MANNFLNRKSLNINLYNKTPYVQKSFKNTLKHGYLSLLKDVTESTIDINENSLGIYISFSKYCKLENSTIKLNYKEYDLIIDNSDRDYTFYKNPYDIIVRFNPTDTTISPYINRKGLHYIKYILIDNIRLPLYYTLTRTSVEIDNIILSIIDTNITNTFNLNNLSGNQLQFTLNRIQNIYSNKEYEIEVGESELKKFQVCNFTYTDNNNWECNYTINLDNSKVYSFVRKLGSNTLVYYSVSNELRLDNANMIYLQIKELNTNNITTDNTLSFYAPLYPKKITKNINPMIQLDCKKNLKIYKDTNLQNIDKLSLCFYDNNFNKLTNNFLDNTVNQNTRLCTCSPENIKYSCPCYYLRHPMNPQWAVNMLFKVGGYEKNFTINQQ